MMNRWLMRKKHFIGIDYGTTKCAVAILSGEETQPEILPLTPDGGWSMPSVIALWRNFNSAANKYNYSIDSVGLDAVTRSTDTSQGGNPLDYAYFERVKLALGREMSKSRMDKEVIERFANVRPEDVAAILLGYLRVRLQRRLDSADEATITVPANWSPKQRRATKFAAYAAGFKDVELAEEPVAALSYVWQSPGKTYSIGNPRENVLVVDFGGGTCDVAIVEIDNRSRFMNILRVEGANGLGGELIDQLILSHVQNDPKFPKEPSGPNAPLYWRPKAETLKIELNDKYLVRAARNLSGDWTWSKFQSPGFSHMLETDVKMTAQALHELLLNERSSELANAANPEDKRSVIQTFDDLIRDVVTHNNDIFIHRVLAVGGSSNLYFVKPTIRKYLPHLGNSETLIVPELPDRCVARGAAWHEKWRWSLVRGAPFNPKLFFSIEIPMADLTRPIPPVIQAPATLPKTAWSYPFYPEAKSESFQVAFRGNPNNMHPDDQVYNQASFVTERGKELLPDKHAIQVFVHASRDGILDLRARENKENIALELKDEFPLSGEGFHNSVSELDSRIVNRNRFFKEEAKK